MNKSKQKQRQHSNSNTQISSLHTWSIECEASQCDRLISLLKLTGHTHSLLTVDNGSAGPSPLFIYSNQSICNSLPPELWNYFTRQFYVPFSAREIDWILHCISNQYDDKTDVIKLVASPRHLTDSINLISDHSNLNFTTNLSSATHVLHIIYSTNSCLFKWGYVTREVARENCLTVEDMNAHKQKQQSEIILNPEAFLVVNNTFPPVCRAFYKMKQVLGIHFATLGWNLPSNPLILDVGASPGGWSQFCAADPSMKNSFVISVDPGELHPLVSALVNVLHVRKTLQTSSLESILNSLPAMPDTESDEEGKGRALDLIICDVNCPANEAGAMLRKFALPFLSGNRTAAQPSSPSIATAAYVILTLKLRKGAKEKSINKSINDATQEISSSTFSPSSWTFHLVHLAANSINERTLLCKLDR